MEADTRSLSIESVGIGATKVPLRVSADEPPRLRPEDNFSENARIYDCIVYLMICSTHNTIAVSNQGSKKIVWLPFVMIQEGMTWQQSAQEGVIIMMGRKDTEVDSKRLKIPKFELTPLHFLRVQMPGEKYYIRYTFFVNIEKLGNQPCCDAAISLNWIPVADILRIENLWGPEVIIFTKMLIDARLQIHEQILEEVLMIFQIEPYGKFLINNKLNQDNVLAIYEEFVEHCYPSLFMCLDSFKAFLIRFGYSNKDGRFPWLFNALIRDTDKAYVDFYAFLIGLICMEPGLAEFDAFRLRMIFRYYKMDNGPNMNLKEFVGLMRDLNPTEQAGLRSQSTMNRTNRLTKNKVDETFKKISEKEPDITYVNFEKAVRNRVLKGTEKLCRSPKPILPQIIQFNKKKLEERQRMTATKTKIPNVKVKDRGICNACRAQHYAVGLHCCWFDYNGRCVKPLRLYDVRLEDTMTPHRYSAEYVFGTNTICRNVLDIVRNCHEKHEGFLTAPEEMIHAFKTVKTLSDVVQHILICEEKLLKINTPAIVIGNVQGNLDSLMALERTFWNTIPILANKLIFLGNYSGPGSKYNVETICYILALKIAAPNMVFLLRGHNDSSDSSKELLAECLQKYGPENGRLIWIEMNKVFNRLPFAIVVDETILCVHSGIPKAGAELAKFAKIPEVVQNIGKESPLAYEIINNVPNDQDKTKSEASLTEKTTSAKKAEFNFHLFFNFMRSNNLSFMIRGHDNPLPDGYRICFDARCITVTSALNKHSMVVVINGHQEELQLVRVLPIIITHKKLTKAQID